MKTLDQMKQIKKQFIAQYSPALSVVGNQLAVGIGKDSVTQEFTIEARLTDATLKTALPDTYQGVKVNVQIVGPIVAF